MNNFKIKVCGITNEFNLNQLTKYSFDYYGFIFYPNSPRYLMKNKNIDFIKLHKNKVAVFVNEEVDKVIDISSNYNFKYIQLHGEESVDYCEVLRRKNLKVIKTFHIKSKDDFKKLNTYTNSIDFALFDYNSINYGGSGKKFDWKILNEIDIKIPFFLSGGISLDNIDKLNFLDNNLNLYGIDINSKFEEYPGYKDLKIIKKLFKKLER